MKAKFLALMLVAGGSLFAGPRVSFGFGFGPAYRGYYAPPPPPVYAYAPPPVRYAAPGYGGGGYERIDGYWNWSGGRYYWQPGFYGRRPYRGAYWVAPRYYSGRYYRGGWARHRY